MRLPRISRRIPKNYGAVQLASPTIKPTHKMALAGAVAAMVHASRNTSPSENRATSVRQTKTPSAMAPPDETIFTPTCEILEATTDSFSSWGKLKVNETDAFTIFQHSPQPLLNLLSMLPYEIRLSIYEYCVPCMWHRKRKVLLDYIVDSKWMATSLAIFNEAAPLIFTRPTLHMYMKFNQLTETETLSNEFDKHIKQTFPEDYSWASPVARSMVETLAVTVKCVFYLFFDHGQEHVGKWKLQDRLKTFFSTVDDFKNLKTLQISLVPDCFPVARDDDHRYFADDWQGEIEEPILQKLECSALVVRSVVPKSCEVVWRLDKAAMPDVGHDLAEKGEARLKYLHGIHEKLAISWRTICPQRSQRNV